MSKLDRALIDRAVKALFQYEAKRTDEMEKGAKKKLLSSYAKPVLVQIQLVQPIKQPALKPVRVMIPNSLFSPEEEDHSICLFCRSSDKAEIESLLEKNQIEGFGKVVTLDQVKRQYALFKEKKKLLREHTHFIVDSRVMQHIYNLLGTTFTSRDHRPLPIDLTKITDTSTTAAAIRGEKLVTLLRKAVDSAHFRKAGATLSLRIGHTGMPASAVLENILVGVPSAVEALPKDWRNIHSIHIKTSDSAALPVYSQDSNEMAQYVVERLKSKEEGGETKKKKEKNLSKESAPETTKLSKKATAVKKATTSPATTKKQTAAKKTVSGRTAKRSLLRG